MKSLSRLRKFYMANEIVILGAGGFIGSYLTKHINNSLPVYRKDLNVVDRDSVYSFFCRLKPKVIINCITFGNKTPHEKNHDDLANNWLLYSLLKDVSEYVEGIINIGSGAEFDMTEPIEYAEEKDIFYKVPKSSYGLAKNLIARDITTQEKFCTLRLFGCFGPGEAETRLFRKFASSKEFHYTNRLFDYFTVQDFTTVVNYVIEQKLYQGTDINCVYPDKLYLDEILLLFKEIKGYNIPLIINDKGLSYTGSHKKLCEIDLPLIGLRKGMELWHQ